MMENEDLDYEYEDPEYDPLYKVGLLTFVEDGYSRELGIVIGYSWNGYEKTWTYDIAWNNDFLETQVHEDIMPDYLDFSEIENEN